MRLAPRRRHWNGLDRHLVAGLAYIAVTLVIGRRVIASLSTAIASDAGDPVLNAAILAWNATHIPWSDAWFQFPIFYPMRDALTLSEHLLGVSMLASPIYWATGNAITTYNLTLLLSYPLCGMAMYALVWRLTRSGPAAFLAGLAYAFAPYRIGQLPHIQVLMSFWAPLALLGLHGFLGLDSAGRPSAGPAPHCGEPSVWGGSRGPHLSRTRLQWLPLFAISWLLQGASNGYLLVYFTVLVGLWMLWFLAAARRWRDVGLVTLSAAVALIPLAPILYRYVATQRALGLSRNLGEIAAFSADIAAPLCAPARSIIWGWLRVACGPEGELFAGLTLVALCVGAGWRSWASSTPSVVGRPFTGRHGAGGASEAGGGRLRVVIRRAAVGIALIFVAIAASVFVAGPWRVGSGWLRASASAADKPLSIAVLLLLVAFVLSPAWRRLLARRSVATFYLLAALVSWVLTWGPFPRLFGNEALYQAPYAWLMQLPGVGGLRVPARFWLITIVCLVVFMGLAVSRLLSRSGRGTSVVIVALATAGLLADGLTTIPVAAIDRRPGADLARRGETVLVLPAGEPERDQSVVYHAVAGGWRAVNGYSGYEPAHYEALRTLSQAADPALFEPFRDRGDVHVIVDESDERMRRLVDAQAGARMIASGGARRHYLMARQPVTRLAAPMGERLGISALTASCGSEGRGFAIDGDLDTRWVCGPQTADGEIRVDLGRLMTVGRIVHTLGPHGADFPRELVIETSRDGTTWEVAWAGSPAAKVLSAALESPRMTRVVLPFSSRGARYVRLRQTGRHAVNYWSIAELEVWSGM